MVGVLEVVEYSWKERFDMKYLHQVRIMSAFARCIWCVPIILAVYPVQRVCLS